MILHSLAKPEPRAMLRYPVPFEAFENLSEGILFAAAPFGALSLESFFGPFSAELVPFEAL